MSKIKLIALFGQSGAGKDTIQHWLTIKYEDIFHGVVLYTTRPPREHEQDGHDYHFTSRDNFINLIHTNQILEYSTFNNWYYGTCKSALVYNKINIGVFSPRAVRTLLSKNEIDVLPVQIIAPDKERLLRSLYREKYPDCEEICRRFLADEKDFENIDFIYEKFYNDQSLDDYSGFLNRPEIAKFMKDKIN